MTPRGLLDEARAGQALSEAVVPPLARAARLWGAAAALREEIGAPVPPNECEGYKRRIADAREAMGEPAFAIAWEAGRALTWAQAAAYALEETT